MDSNEKRNNFSPPVEKKEVSNNISWQQLIYLVSQKWGLRHTVDVNAAKKEIKEGIENGDAVSLSHPNNFIPSSISKYPEVEKLKNLSFNTLAPFIPEECKQDIISGFEQATQRFIKESIGLDINSLPLVLEASTQQILDTLMANRLAFVIAQFKNADHPYDFDNYYQLGKCGKQQVPLEKMIALINLENNVDLVTANLNFSPDELASTMSKEKFEKILNVFSEIIWNNIVELIKNKMPY
jgi:hypothetical protein